MLHKHPHPTQPGSAPITSWQWAFGDATTSTIQNPVHTFQFPGTFAVTLVTTDAITCSATRVRSAYIVVNPTPNANFSANSALGCTAPFCRKFFQCEPYAYTVSGTGFSGQFIQRSGTITVIR